MALGLRVALAAVILMGSSLVLASPVQAAFPYDGTNPGVTPCGDGSHPVVTISTAAIYAGNGTRIGRVELRQSVYCGTVWARVWNESQTTRDLKERIVLFDSPNLTGKTTHTVTDNSIPPGGSAWSKQYHDRPAFRAHGKIYQGGAWRSASTDDSLMWSQREGNYADNPPTQPYTCGDVANPCVRWRTNANGSPITLYYLNSASLQQLPGDPYGDINFILGKYTNLSGPAPNLAPSVGTYQIINYAYNDPNNPNVYAVALSAAGSDHYFYSGYTKYNTAATFAAGYRPVECHEFLHVLGFNHITVNGHTGSQATCMGYSYATGPQVDDQYLLDQTYGAPVGP